MSERYDGGPVAALRRIAFLLERGREDTYKVKAYRAAAAAILPLPADEVAARVEAGTLTDLPGVGASTAKVIADAVRGVVPERLAKLEKEHAGPLVPGGRELRSQLRGRPALPLRLVRRRLADRGDGVHRDRARPRVPRAHRPLAPAHRGPRPEPRAAHPPARRGRGGQRPPDRSGAGSGFTLLKGIEVDILDDGALDQTDELLSRLDVRVASVHSKLKMEPAT